MQKNDGGKLQILVMRDSCVSVPECCNYSVKYFNFIWCEVEAASEQRLGLLSVVLVSWWRLVCVTKVAI